MLANQGLTEVLEELPFSGDGVARLYLPNRIEDPYQTKKTSCKCSPSPAPFYRVFTWMPTSIFCPLHRWWRIQGAFLSPHPRTSNAGDRT